LIVEISDTTLAFDRRQKAGLYARAGIAEYWIVNLVDRQLEIFQTPRPDPAHPFQFSYGRPQIHRAGESIHPPAAAHAAIPVANLLP
jgi:Uma2 family endonuclease